MYDVDYIKNENKLKLYSLKKGVIYDFDSFNLIDSDYLGNLYKTKINKGDRFSNGLLYEFYPKPLANDIVREGSEIYYKPSVYKKYQYFLAIFMKLYHGHITNKLLLYNYDLTPKPSDILFSENESLGRGTCYIYYDVSLEKLKNKIMDIKSIFMFIYKLFKLIKENNTNNNLLTSIDKKNVYVDSEDRIRYFMFSPITNFSEKYVFERALEYNHDINQAPERRFLINNGDMKGFYSINHLSNLYDLGILSVELLSNYITKKFVFGSSYEKYFFNRDNKIIKSLDARLVNNMDLLLNNMLSIYPEKRIKLFFKADKIIEEILSRL